MAAGILTLGPYSGSPPPLDLLDEANQYVKDATLSFKPNRYRVIVETTGRDIARLAHTRAQHLEIDMQLVVTGPDLDTANANFEAVESMLYRARQYSEKRIGTQMQLTLQERGSSNSVIFNVFDGDMAPPPNYEVAEVLNATYIGVQVTLVCEPFARYSTAITENSGTLTNYGSWTPTAAQGTQPIPTRLRVQTIGPMATTVPGDWLGSIVDDQFGRPINTTTLGMTSNAQTWMAGSGTWGITTTSSLPCAYDATPSGSDYTYIQSNVANCLVQVTVEAVDTGNHNQGIIFRYNGSSFWAFVYNGSTGQFSLINPANSGVTTTGSNTMSAGDTMAVIANGSSIRCFHNGNLLAALSITSSANQTATEHGLFATTSTSTFTNFMVNAFELNYIRIAGRKIGNPANFIFQYRPGLVTPDSGYTVTLPGAASRIGQIQLTVSAENVGGGANLASAFEIVWRTPAGLVVPIDDMDITVPYNTGFNTYTRTAFINPATQLPWTPGDINDGSTYINGQFGVQRLDPLSNLDQINIQTLEIDIFYPDRNLVTQSTGQLQPTADGAVDNWSKTAGTTHGSLTIPGQYIHSNTDGQQSFVKYNRNTSIIASDGGLRAQFAPLLKNGALNGFATNPNGYAGYTTSGPYEWSIYLGTGGQSLSPSAYTGTNSALPSITQFVADTYLILTNPNPAYSFEGMSLGNITGPPVIMNGGTVPPCYFSQVKYIIGGASYRVRSWQASVVNGVGITGAPVVTAYTNGASPAQCILSQYTYYPAVNASNIGIASGWTLYEGTFVAPIDATQVTFYIGVVGASATAPTSMYALFGPITLTRDDLPATQMVQFTINSNLADHFGHFRLETRMNSGLYPCQTYCKFGGVNGSYVFTNPAQTVAIQNNLAAIVPFGRVDIPERESTQAITLASFPFTLWLGESLMENVNYNAYLDMDATCLWPTDDGMYSEFLPFNTGVQIGEGPQIGYYAVLDAEGVVVENYVADTNGNFVESIDYIGAPWFITPDSTTYYLGASRSQTNDVLTDQALIELHYSPRVVWQH